MASEGTIRDWVVGEIAAHYRTNYTQAAVSRVVRVGKRDVVLEDGFRFNAQRPSVHAGSSYHGWNEVATVPSDPRFVLAVVKTRENLAKAAAKSAASRFANPGSGKVDLQTEIDRAKELRDALDEWLAAQSAVLWTTANQNQDNVQPF